MTDGQFWGLILALIVQTGALFFWGGTVHRAIGQHEKRLDKHEERLLEGGL